jgi:hypothetical protein
MKKIIVLGCIAGLAFLLWRYQASWRGNYWFCNEQHNWTKRGNPPYPSPVISCKGAKPLGKTKKTCLAQGGVWAKQGPDPFATCDRKTIDRGNLCRDNQECEGWCQIELTREELRQGMSGKLISNRKYGQCSVWVVELGCFGMMEEGKPKVICID